MPNVYLRRTALYNIGGRINYISDPERQEHLLAYEDGAKDLLQGRYWKELAKECQAAHAQNSERHKRANEGAELVIQLPNSVLDRLTTAQVCHMVREYFSAVTYGVPAAVALHYNKSKTNLHAHIIYGERDLLPEPREKIAPRKLFFDEQGKRRYKKGEILDEDGQLRPGCRIIQKGEVYERHLYGPVDQEIHGKHWMELMKTDWLPAILNGPLRGDTEYTVYDRSSGKLPQQHIGKELQPEQATAVQEYNALVKEYNALIETGKIAPEMALEAQQTVLHAQERAPALKQCLQGLQANLAPFGEVRVDDTIYGTARMYGYDVPTQKLCVSRGNVLWIAERDEDEYQRTPVRSGSVIQADAYDWRNATEEEEIEYLHPATVVYTTGTHYYAQDKYGDLWEGTTTEADNVPEEGDQVYVRQMMLIFVDLERAQRIRQLLQEREYEREKAARRAEREARAASSYGGIEDFVKAFGNPDGSRGSRSRDDGWDR